MDYTEEQKMEVEAIKSIFGEDYKKINSKTFELTLVPYPGENEENHVSVILKIKYPSKYPEVVPEITLTPVKNVTKKMLEAICELAKAAAQESVGNPMVFNITEAIKEYLVANNKKEKTMHEQMMDRLETAEEDEIKEPDGPKPEDYISPLGIEPGTLVTADSFRNWEKLYLEEQQKLKPPEKKSSGKTGKQIFLENDKLGLEEDDDGKAEDEKVFYFNEELYKDDDLDDDDETKKNQILLITMMV